MALDAFLVLLVRILGRGSVFIVLTILSRVLSLEDLGSYGFVTVSAYTLVYFVSMGMRHASAYFVGNKIESRHSIYLAVSIHSFIASVLGFLIIRALMFEYSTFSLSSDGYLLSAFAFVPLLFVFALQGIFLGTGEIGRFNSTELVPRLLNLFLIAIAYYLDVKLDFDTAVGIFIVSNSVGAIYALVTAYPGGPGWGGVRSSAVSVMNIYPSLIKYGFPLSITLALVMLSPTLSMYIAKNSIDAVALGAFFLAYKLSDIVSEAATAAGMVAFSRGVRATSARRALSVALRASWIVGVIGAFSGTMMLLFSEVLISLMLGAKDDSVHSVLMIVALSLPFLCFARVLNPSLAAQGYNFSGVVIQGVALLVNVTLAIYLSRDFGVEGVAAALAISRIVAAVAFAFVAKEVLGVGWLRVILLSERERTVIGVRVLRFPKKVLRHFGI